MEAKKEHKTEIKNYEVNLAHLRYLKQAYNIPLNIDMNDRSVVQYVITQIKLRSCHNLKPLVLPEIPHEIKSINEHELKTAWSNSQMNLNFIVNFRKINDVTYDNTYSSVQWTA
jgi:hypothetical protein